MNKIKSNMRQLSRQLTSKSLCVLNFYRTISSNQNWVEPKDGFDTGIRVYNCAAQNQVPLILNNDAYATWYTCGPTVYDTSHLGHASCYVKLDILQRILRDYFNINLVTAMNVTDIDDKIITKSIESNNDWREITKFYEAQFWSDMKKLNVVEPTFKIRVTDHVMDTVKFIESIVKKRLAYCTMDGSVYFDVKKFPLYGKLQKINLAANEKDLLQANLFGAAVEQEPLGEKLSAHDFALWKAKKLENEPSWKSPWGDGRPGWHIECSTLASLIFGDTIDIHAGGIDLKFPHHENEEAQSCVFHNKSQWVNYWLHTGHLIVKGEKDKMSKSLQNTISVEELLLKYTSDEFRMACLLSNYKNDVEYSDELMETARNTFNKFKSFHDDCDAYKKGKKDGAMLEPSVIHQHLIYTKAQVDLCLKNDFDTARAIRILLNQANSISRCINASGQRKTGSCLDAIAAVDNYVQQTMGIFGFHCGDKTNITEDISKSKVNWDGLVEDILQSRDLIRERAFSEKDKNLFKICDELRDCLKQHGIDVQDHKKGSTWKVNVCKKS